MGAGVGQVPHVTGQLSLTVPNAQRLENLLGDPVTVLPILVLEQEVQVVLAGQHSSGRKAQHRQYCYERPVVDPWKVDATATREKRYFSLAGGLELLWVVPS